MEYKNCRGSSATGNYFKRTRGEAIESCRRNCKISETFEKRKVEFEFVERRDRERRESCVVRIFAEVVTDVGESSILISKEAK